MVGFGKSILRAKRAAWETAYIDYDGLKRIVVDTDAEEESGEHFFSTLRRDIEKVSLFILWQQGKIADAIGTLKFGASFHNNNNSLWKDDNSHNAPVAVVEAYVSIGVELLELQVFILLNSIGVRKILKKYHKLFEQLDDKPSMEVGSEEHLHQLSYSRSLLSIQSSLCAAWTELCHNNQQQQTTSIMDTSMDDALYRFHFVLSCSFLLKRNAEILGLPKFYEFVSRKSHLQLLGGMDKKALQWLLALDPEALVEMNRRDLEVLWTQWSVGPRTISVTRTQEGFSNLQDTVGIGCPLSDIQEDAEILLANGGGRTWGGVNARSMVLNFLSTLLYTVNYYIVCPNANHYAIQLGQKGAMGSVLIGASSFSALFAALLYSLWYTRFSFKSALVFSSVCAVSGNVLYGLAISYNSMSMAIMGRILCGFGSAEVINRQLISACVNFEGMTRASALFVAAGASGMSIGPLLAGILDMTAGRDMDIDLKFPLSPQGGIIFNHVTSPGFVMACLWFIELVALVTFFEEPVRINGKDSLSTKNGLTNEEEREISDEGQPLIEQATKQYGTLAGDQKDTSLRQKAVATVMLILQNPALPVTIALFGYIEMVDEVLISSCSMVVRRYFDWKGNVAGFLIASLGALVLPAHFVVEKAVHYYSERKILFRSLIFILVSLLGILNWSGLIFDLAGAIVVDTNVENSDIPKLDIGNTKLGSLLTHEGELPYDFGAGPVVYIVFLSLVFLGTIVLEGVDTSIMSKSTPGALNDNFFNCGLLATLVGTLGRVAGDSMITMSAVLDINVFVDFVNTTFLPLIILTAAGLCVVNHYYQTLV